MAHSPSAPPQSEVELYRAVMHRSLTNLRASAPAISVPTLTDTEAPPAVHYQPSSESKVTSLAGTGTTGRVLVVDDEVLLARAYARALRHHGLESVCVPDAAGAVSELRCNSYDVVVCDIGLPDHSGLELLRHVRNSDPDLPMVLVTGSPDLDSAIEAVTLGAFRYMVKPLSNPQLLGCIAQACRARQLAQLRERTLQRESTRAEENFDLSSAFDRALEPLWIAYQPIITWPQKTVVSYQALVRSDEPSLALPSAIHNAAQLLGRTSELHEAVQRSVARTAQALPSGTRILLSTTTREILESSPCAPNSSLISVANRIALEVADSASLCEGSGFDTALPSLYEQGFQLALCCDEDSPPTHERLSLLRPQLLKVRVAAATEHSSEKLRQALEWSRSQGASLIVSGVERVEERNALAAAGCELFQDCLFDHPGR